MTPVDPTRPVDHDAEPGAHALVHVGVVAAPVVAAAAAMMVVVPATQNQRQR